jgi:hypothetical protein
MLDRWVRLSAPTTQDTRVEIEIQASDRMKKFIEADSFFAEYSSSIEEIPDGVLTVPAVANIAPVCWATDADLFIDTLDRRFFDSLRDVQCVFSDFYSILETSADMIVNETADTPAHTDVDGESGSGLLFSGGVDSLTTLVRHHAESPTLFTFKIKEDYPDRWQRAKSLSSKYAAEYGLENQFIRTNCQRFINVSKLSALFGCEITDGAWWSGVQHGMGLLGLCAPVAYDNGLSDLHIASSYTEEFNQPWGSHPAIDDKVAWSGTTCHHDGFELSRQQKIALLASHVEQQNTNLPVRVCTSSGENCSRCEKCCRTIIGLMVAGADPTEHGFTVSEDIFDHIRIQFESGCWEFGFDEVYMWSDIQRHTPAPETVDDPELASFYRWLRGIDPENYRETSSQGLKRNVRDALVRNLPYPYFDVISLLYSRFKPSRIRRALAE